MSDAIYDAIDAYVSHGIYAFPLIKNKVLVPLNEDTGELPTKNDIKRWRKKFSSADSVAILCGRISRGIECIDVDSMEKYDYIVELLMTTGTYGNLDYCYQEYTPSGGVHIIYRSRSPANKPTFILNENNEIVAKVIGDRGIVKVYPTPGYIPFSAKQLFDMIAKNN